MTKMWQVLRFEIVTLVSRFSFWFGLLGLPLIGFIVFAVAAFINLNASAGNPSQNPMNSLGQLFSAPVETRPFGLVDQSGLIKTIPESFTETLIVYSATDQASQALARDEVRGYFVVPGDYLQQGKITYYQKTFNVFSEDNREGLIASVLASNLLPDATLLERYNNPIKVKEQPLAPPSTPQREEDNALTFFIPYAVMMLFYIVILGSASLMLSSISKEKENRVIETLMVSVTPTDLLTGKMIALGLVGLLQVLIWSSSGLIGLVLGGTVFSLSSAFQLSPTILLWGILFFLLGYAVYACLMEGIGALAPNLREGSQATTLVILPLIVPLFMINALIQDPNGSISTVLSIFPLTAPTTMMLRLSSATVPPWQILLALVLLAATAYLIVRVVAGLFRAQTLLSGQPFNVRRFLLALIGRGG